MLGLLSVFLFCFVHSGGASQVECKRYGLNATTMDSFHVADLAPKAGAKALVTGVAGFIASHVARECVQLGFDVIGVDDLSGGFMKNIPAGVRFVPGDLKDAAFVSKLMEDERFDVVFHLAAYAAEGLSHFIRNYNYQNNLVASTNLITQSVRVGSVKRFVFTSSVAVYGSGGTRAHAPRHRKRSPEGDRASIQRLHPGFSEEQTPRPEDPYGISKFAVEMDLHAAHQMFGLEFVIFRPHNVYGPGQNMYDRYRNVIGIFLNQLSAGKNLTVFGDGDQTRKFSYITDVAKPIALGGIHPFAAGHVFNVGGDIATTVEKLAQVTMDAWGNAGVDIVHLDSRNEVAHAESDHTKLNCFFPGLPEPIQLREGMHEMVKWAKNVGKYYAPVQFSTVEVKKKMPPSWVTAELQETPAFAHTSSDNKVGALEGGSQTPNRLTPQRPFVARQKGLHPVGVNEQHPPKSRTLVVICTAASLWTVTEKMLLSLATTNDVFDLLLIDDKSKQVDIEKNAESLGISVLRWPGTEPRGNTHLWNLAWNYAVERGYVNLIICNNDLLVPDGTIDKLVEGLDAGWAWLNPVTSKRGSRNKDHRLQDHYQLPSEGDWTDSPLHYQNVQDALNKIHDIKRIKKQRGLNGYMMAFRVHRMQEFQIANQSLFDPQFLNTDNENDLCRRIDARDEANDLFPRGVHTSAFVFHYKGTTLFRSLDYIHGKRGQGKDDPRNVLGEAAFGVGYGDPNGAGSGRVNGALGEKKKKRKEGGGGGKKEEREGRKRKEKGKGRREGGRI